MTDRLVAPPEHAREVPLQQSASPIQLLARKVIGARASLDHQPVLKDKALDVKRSSQGVCGQLRRAASLETVNIRAQVDDTAQPQLGLGITDKRPDAACEIRMKMEQTAGPDGI